MNNKEYIELTKDYGVLLDRVDNEVLNELKVGVDVLKDNFKTAPKHNDYLVGEIEHEYRLKIGPKLNHYIAKIAKKYEDKTKYASSNYAGSNLIFRDVWVNFQKKHEYNPIHHHDGVFSFVIWYQIPFTFEQENKFTYKSPKNKANHGDFMFCYPNVRGGKLLIEQLGMQIDKSSEGMMAMFPSSLNHSVNPFYSSNDYRITIAGNIMAQSMVK